MCQEPAVFWVMRTIVELDFEIVALVGKDDEEVSTFDSVFFEGLTFNPYK